MDSSTWRQIRGLIVVGNPDLKSKAGLGTLLMAICEQLSPARLAFNPEGKLNGAHRITIAGTYAYVLCNNGLVVVGLDNPLAPKITAEIAARPQGPTRIAVQFRYAFVVDAKD